MSAIYDQADGERIAVADTGDSVSIINRTGKIVVAKKDIRRLAERVLAAAGRMAVVLFPPSLRKETLSVCCPSGRWKVSVSPKNGARVLVEVDPQGLGPAEAYELAAAVAVAGRHIGDTEQADRRMTTRIREVLEANQGRDAETVAAAIVAQVLDGTRADGQGRADLAAAAGSRTGTGPEGRGVSSAARSAAPAGRYWR